MNEQSPFESSAPLPSNAAGGSVNLSKSEAPPGAPATGNDVDANADSTGAAPNPVLALVAARNSGANWFFWIVGLSVINTLIALTGNEWGFSLGLGSTLLSDGLAQEAITEGSASSVRFIALGVDLLIFAFYAMCGIKAMRGATWAFWLGLVFFALDTLLMLAVKEWLGVALHAWALISMWSGLSANQKLKRLQMAQQLAGAPTPWSG